MKHKVNLVYTPNHKLRTENSEGLKHMDWCILKLAISHSFNPVHLIFISRSWQFIVFARSIMNAKRNVTYIDGLECV